MATKSERNYGIDILRILSMLMIIILHILGQGAVLSNTTGLSIQYEFAWLLEIASYCAVNCYGIISGYVCLNSKTKYSKPVLLWLQTAFYTIGFMLIFSLIGSELVTKERIINSFFPISSRLYWYITSYFILIILMPLLNIAIKRITETKLRIVLYALFVFMCVIPTFLKFHFFNITADPYRLDGGYSLLWLIYLYLLGAYIRKKESMCKIQSRCYILVYLLMVFLTWIIKYMYETHGMNEFGNVLVDYTSPTIVCSGVCLFCFFVRIDIKRFLLKKIIKLFTSVTLGVYIIHTNPFIWNEFEGFASVYAKQFPILLIIEVIFTACVIYVVSTFIELVRLKLFELLKVNQFLHMLELKVRGEKI